MAFRAPFAARLLGWGLAVGGLGALGASGCGGTSVEHVGDGGTSSGRGGSGASTGGTGSGGTGGSRAATCSTVGGFAGPEYVDWSVSPDQSCEGMEVFCYEGDAPPLGTCLDGGVPAPGRPAGDVAPPAPPKFGCPNVRTLCSTQIGCCESIYTLVAGPHVTTDAPNTLPCCYLAQPGSWPR